MFRESRISSFVAFLTLPFAVNLAPVEEPKDAKNKPPIALA